MSSIIGRIERSNRVKAASAAKARANHVGDAALAMLQQALACLPVETRDRLALEWRVKGGHPVVRAIANRVLPPAPPDVVP